MRVSQYHNGLIVYVLCRFLDCGHFYLSLGEIRYEEWICQSYCVVVDLLQLGESIPNN
jgi:hypothetical protein